MRPVVTSTSKIKKNLATGVIDGLESIALEATPDILAGLGASKRPGQVLVGFAAETENLVANAQAKLKKKNVDLIVANNVLAHSDDLMGIFQGIKLLMGDETALVIEFSYALDVFEKLLIDTIYHEHFSYLSLYTVDRIFKAASLRVWEIEALSTHGGSLRVYGCHNGDSRAPTRAVTVALAEEAQRGLQTLSTYQHYQAKADKIKDDLLAFLIEQKRAGRRVAAYGAAAKGSTLLNYAGVKPDLLPFVCDAAVAKQGKFMPGSHIPILAPTVLLEQRPDYLVILPWNIAAEVKQQNARLAELGTKFVTAVPQLEIA